MDDRDTEPTNRNRPGGQGEVDELRRREAAAAPPPSGIASSAADAAGGDLGGEPKQAAAAAEDQERKGLGQSSSSLQHANERYFAENGYMTSGGAWFGLGGGDDNETFLAAIAPLESLARKRLNGQGRRSAQAAFHANPDGVRLIIDDILERCRATPRSIRSPLGLLVKRISDGDHMAPQVAADPGATDEPVTGEADRPPEGASPFRVIEGGKDAVA